MREFGISSSIARSTGSFERPALWLNRLSHTQVWGLVIISAVAVTAFGWATQRYELDVDTLYILPISVACWMFKIRKSIAATLTISLLALTNIALRPDPQVYALLFEGALRIVAFTFLAIIVISCRQVFDHAQSLATHDRMTGALNKETFGERAKQLLIKTGLGQPYLLALLDLDGFKSVNDQHGHDEGDVVLKQFARGVQASLGYGDCLGRIGGDEFVMLMPVDSVSGGFEAAARIHRSLAAVLGGSSHAVTCSMGALIVRAGSNQSYEELVREADQLMYVVKRSGKNAVNISTSPITVKVAVSEHGAPGNVIKAA